MLCGVRVLPQVALLAVLLGSAANAGEAKYYAFTNSECEGEHVAVVHSEVEVHAQGYLSYEKEGEDECVDVSRWEVVVVTGIRVVDRVRWFDWPDSTYSSTHVLEWSDSMGAWLGYVPVPRPVIRLTDFPFTGRCVRPVDLVDLPADLPGWIRNAIPEHHDVRTRNVPSHGATETTTRGFFAVSMTQAVLAVWAQSAFPLVSGYVDAVIEDSSATAGPCHLDEVSLSKYEGVLAAIKAKTTGRYHLLHYNCQDWATEMLAK